MRSPRRFGNYLYHLDMNVALAEAAGRDYCLALRGDLIVILDQDDANAIETMLDHCECTYKQLLGSPEAYTK